MKTRHINIKLQVRYIIKDRVNKENVDEFIYEFESYVKKAEKFNYGELEKDSKTIYDMLQQIKIC